MEASNKKECDTDKRDPDKSVEIADLFKDI